MTVLADFFAFKKRLRLAMAIQRVYNDCDGMKSFLIGFRNNLCMCNPAAMARDLPLFHEGSYSVGSTQPEGLFPQTLHVESVCLMSKVYTRD